MAMGITAYRPITGLCDMERVFVNKLRGSVDDAMTWLAYADWLDEQGRPIEALEARAKTGKYKVIYRATYRGGSQRWSFTQGRLDLMLKKLQEMIDTYDYVPSSIIVTATLIERRPEPTLSWTYEELKDYDRPKPGRRDKKI